MSRGGWTLFGGAIALALGACGQDDTGREGHLAPREALLRANDLSARHRVAEALAVIDSALAARGEPSPPRGPDALALLERKGTLLLALSRPKEAASILEKVAGGGGSPWRWLAQAHLEAGDAGKAVPAFERLRGEALAGALMDYGSALVAAGRPGDGLTAIAASLLRDPWDEKAYLAIGRALARAGRGQEAGTFLERYRRSEPFRRAEEEATRWEFLGNDARGLLERALAERRRGRLFEAIELLNRALRKDPGLGAAFIELARISIFLEKPGDAVDVLRRLPPDPAVLETLEEARREPGAAGDDLEALRASIRESIRGSPLSSSVDALLPLVEALKKHGKADDARALGLFLLRLAPAREEARLAVIRSFDGPGDVFIRLWAAEPARGPEAAAVFAAETSRLAIEPDALRRAARGEPFRASH